jgi:hypothetical protein
MVTSLTDTDNRALNRSAIRINDPDDARALPMSPNPFTGLVKRGLLSSGVGFACTDAWEEHTRPGGGGAELEERATIH